MQMYKNLWNFAQLQKACLEDTKHKLIRRLSIQEIRSSVKNNFTWKFLAFFDAFIFTILSLLIVTIVGFAVPEVINDPLRTAVFWIFIFLQLFLGLLTFVALFQNSTLTLRLICAATIFLQLLVLGVTSTYKGYCGSVMKQDFIFTKEDWSFKDCLNYDFVSSKIILPNFIHSLIFSAILITYLYKQGGGGVEREEEDLEVGGIVKKTFFKLANITVIIEEVA